MRYCLVLLLGASALVTTGCSVGYLAPVRPHQGMILTNFSAPLSVDFKQTPVCSKVGTVSTFYIYDPFITGLDFAWGRADIAEAASRGGLKTIEYADYNLYTVLGVFCTFTIKAYGN